MSGKNVDVLAICHQIGGARAVGPAIQLLVQDGLHVVTIGYGLSARGFAEQGISFHAPQEYGGDADTMHARVQPRVILSGTSAGETMEKALVWQAKQRGVPTVAVLDHWVNYLARFGGATGAWHYLPDRLTVMDEVAHADLLALGCPADRLVVTGQPYFDDLPALLAVADRETIRRDLGIARDERLIVFASEPQARDYGDALGYTEVDSLHVLLDVLDEMGGNWRVLVKPHPTESSETLEVEMARHRVRAAFAPDLPPRELMIAADVVVGMTSLFLVEAALLGCPTVSLQPGLRGKDSFIGKRLSLTKSAHDVATFRAALIEIVGGIPEDYEARKARAAARWTRLSIDGRAAERVGEVVTRFL